MHVHGTSHKNNISEMNQKKIRYAAYAALAVSGILCCLKFGNYFKTGSDALYASALDSLMDVIVSLANFGAIFLMQQNKNETFKKGFDKVASFVAFLQALMIFILATSLIRECYDHILNPTKVSFDKYSIIILLFSIFLNWILVSYQKKVVDETGSLIIKADMLHFKTDFLSNFALLIGISFIYYFETYKLDAILGLFVSIYLLFSVYELFIESIYSLLDLNLKDEMKKALSILNKNDISIDQSQITVTFSGTENIVEINSKDIKSDKVETIRQILSKDYSVKIII